jgi:hypothetical protein
MSSPLSVPTTTFDPTKIVYGAKTYAVFTPTGGSAVNFVGKLMEPDFKTETVNRSVPDASGALRPDATRAKSAEETFTLTDLEEIDTVLAFMGGLTGIKIGTVQLFIVDPASAVNTIRLSSDVFNCTAMVKSGTMKIGGGDFSKISLSFVSNKGSAGAVALTPNAATA